MAKYYYITSLGFENVFRTQIISWLELYRKEGIDFKIIKLFGYRKILYHTSTLSIIKDIQHNYDGSVGYLYFLPNKYWISSIINLFCLAIYISGDILFRRKIVIQTRSIDIHRPLKYLKKIAPGRIRIIFDCRAAAAEEYIYKRQLSGNINSVAKALLSNEISMLNTADYVFFVSNALRNYFLSVRSELARKHHFIYPCNSDQNLFYYTENERILTKKELNIDNKILLCYSGGFALPWHLPLKVLEIFQNLVNINHNYHLLLLTNDTEVAIKCVKSFKIDPSQISILCVPNKEVRKYLVASDFGLLFREDVPMNNVASPTKFAEYLMSGLPVLISKGVGDFSEIVKNMNLGILLDDLKKPDYHLLNKRIIEYLSTADKHTLANEGRSMYSKQSILPEVIKHYHIS